MYSYFLPAPPLAFAVSLTFFIPFLCFFTVFFFFLRILCHHIEYTISSFFFLFFFKLIFSGRERNINFVVPLIYAFIGCCLYMPRPEVEPTTSALFGQCFNQLSYAARAFCCLLDVVFSYRPCLEGLCLDSFFFA